MRPAPTSRHQLEPLCALHWLCQCDIWNRKVFSCCSLQKAVQTGCSHVLQHHDPCPEQEAARDPPAGCIFELEIPQCHQLLGTVLECADNESLEVQGFILTVDLSPSEELSQNLTYFLNINWYFQCRSHGNPNCARWVSVLVPCDARTVLGLIFLPFALTLVLWFMLPVPAA